MHDLYNEEIYRRLQNEDLLREAEQERLILNYEKMQVNKHNRMNNRVQAVRTLRVSVTREPGKNNHRQITLEV
jgi:hypothetical protein